PPPPTTPSPAGRPGPPHTRTPRTTAHTPAGRRPWRHPSGTAAPPTPPAPPAPPPAAPGWAHKPTPVPHQDPAPPLHHAAFSRPATGPRTYPGSHQTWPRRAR